MRWLAQDEVQGCNWYTGMTWEAALANLKKETHRGKTDKKPQGGGEGNPRVNSEHLPNVCQFGDPNSFNWSAVFCNQHIECYFFFQEQTKLRSWWSVRVVQDLLLGVEARLMFALHWCGPLSRKCLFILVDGSVLGIFVLSDLKLVSKSGPRLLALDKAILKCTGAPHAPVVLKVLKWNN